MKSPTKPPADPPVRLSDKVAAIIAALPPKMAARIQHDTERMLRDAHAERRQTWKRRIQRHGRRWSGPASY